MKSPITPYGLVISSFSMGLRQNIHDSLFFLSSSTIILSTPNFSLKFSFFFLNLFFIFSFIDIFELFLTGATVSCRFNFGISFCSFSSFISFISFLSFIISAISSKENPGVSSCSLNF